MKTSFNIFVLWFLLIAIPFQGYAAAALMCCGSEHAKGADHAAQYLAMQDDMHAHLSNMNDDHDAGAAAAGLASATESDAGAHPHAGVSSKRAAFKCNACAGCCAGAVIVQISDYSFGVAPLNSTRIAFLSRYFYRFVPETLERPPYRLIA